MLFSLSLRGVKTCVATRSHVFLCVASAAHFLFCGGMKMLCVPKNYQNVLYERDCAVVPGEEAGKLTTALKRLPQMKRVGKPVRDNLLRLAEICIHLSESYRSCLTVSVDEYGDAVRFLMVQRVFGAFLPKMIGLPELLTLATAFTVTPSAENVCVTIDFAVADRMTDFAMEQMRRGLPDLEL